MGSTDTQTPRADPAPTTAPAAPSGSESAAKGCSTDADCQAVDSYCGGCQCLALPAGTAAPKCAGNEVQCLVAPCRGQHAMCKAGSCVVMGSGGDM